LSWGYRGTGPKTLALLLTRLLSDINAPGIQPQELSNDVPPKLLADIDERWKAGGVITRAELLAGRGKQP
jgi:hypothetical protein